jgi:hypothetical protein
MLIVDDILGESELFSEIVYRNLNEFENLLKIGMEWRRVAFKSWVSAGL